MLVLGEQDGSPDEVRHHRRARRWKCPLPRGGASRETAAALRRLRARGSPADRRRLRHRRRRRGWFAAVAPGDRAGGGREVRARRAAPLGPPPRLSGLGRGQLRRVALGARARAVPSPRPDRGARGASAVRDDGRDHAGVRRRAPLDAARPRARRGRRRVGRRRRVARGGSLRFGDREGEVLGGDAGRARGRGGAVLHANRGGGGGGRLVLGRRRVL